MPPDLSFLRPQERRTVALALAAGLMVALGWGARALIMREAQAAPLSQQQAAVLMASMASMTEKVDALTKRLDKSDDKVEALTTALARVQGRLDGADQ